MPHPDDLITRILNEGGPDSWRQLVPLLYDELRRLARYRMARLAPGQTLQPTALVHEVLLRLDGHADREWENRRHFFYAASRAMHDILVEAARRKARLKRGGDQERVELDDEAVAIIDAPGQDMLHLKLVLEKLEKENPESHEIVMLRYFSGLTMEEIANATGSSLATVERKWRFAKAWLGRQLATVG